MRTPLDAIRRRDFLRLLGSGAAVSATGLFGVACGDGASSGTTEPAGDRVIVIGAGTSGLTVANALTTAGVETVVLEARDRLGGRVWSADVGGVPVDLGGMWIHGARGNPAACILNHEGVRWRSAPFYGFDTRIFDAMLQRNLNDDERIAVATATFQFDEALPDLVGRLGLDATVADALSLYLDDAGLGPDARRHAEFGIHTEVELLSAQSPSQISLASYFGVDDAASASARIAQDADPDGDNFPDGSYRPLVNALARGVDVRFETIVSRIEHSSDGVVVETSDGTERGSHVVVTVPLGVLKAGSIEFSPELPAPKRAAIDGLAMAELEKVVLRYDEAFWQLSGPGNILHMGTTLGEFPLVVDYSPFAGGQPTAVAFYCGSFGQEMASLSDDAIVARASTMMTQMSDVAPRAPAAAHVTRWKSDPFAFGSYPGYAVRASVEEARREGAHYEAMAAPVGDRVLFAGDGTSYDFGSTVEGAIVTGIREAERLLGREGQGAVLDSGLLVASGCDENA